MAVNQGGFLFGDFLLAALAQPASGLPPGIYFHFPHLTAATVPAPVRLITRSLVLPEPV